MSLSHSQRMSQNIPLTQDQQLSFGDKVDHGAIELWNNFIQYDPELYK